MGSGLVLVMVLAALVGHLGVSLKGQREAESGRDLEPIYHCDIAGVQLYGTLTEHMFYGPPGFGETPAKDLHDKVLVLRLATPITIKPAENAAKNSPNLNTFHHVRQIQLFFSGSQEREARQLLGKNVVAVGNLDEATAPRQYTDVTMTVKTLRPN